MVKETTPRVSFSLTPATSSRPNPSPPQDPQQSFPIAAASLPADEDSGSKAEDGVGVARPEFITFFDGSQTLEAEPVILPPRPNSKMKKDLPFPGPEEDHDSWKFREDMKELPEHRGMEEFRRLGVEQFPIAYLAGYGWSQGQVIGRNKMLQDPKIVEYTGRRGTEGLRFHDKPKRGS